MRRCRGGGTIGRCEPRTQSSGVKAKSRSHPARSPSAQHRVQRRRRGRSRRARGRPRQPAHGPGRPPAAGSPGRPREPAAGASRRPSDPDRRRRAARHHRRAGAANRRPRAGSRHRGCFLVVLPLKEGALARARELIAAGPPFDPSQAGLLRHHVFLLEHEAIFVFEAARDDKRLHRLLGRPDLWAAAESWGELAAGPPHVAEGVYDWERAAEAGMNGFAGTLSFEPTPGPGDSDGGELYAP